MLTKGKITFFSILCILSLISYGFAAWTISAPSYDYVEGGLLTDKVIKTDDYVYLDKTKGDKDGELFTGYTNLKYEQTAYLDKNGEMYTDTGILTVYYKIDLEKCLEIFNEYNSLKINAILKYYNNNDSDLNIFSEHKNNDGHRSISHEVICDNEYTSFATSLNREYVIDITFENILFNYLNNDSASNIFEFSINYKFFATTGVYFYNNIYKYLSNDEIKFSVNLQITGE